METRNLPLSQILSPDIAVRSVADEQQFAELRASMQEHGLIQPVVVVPEGGGYRLVVGDRRLKAAMTLGWETIEARIANYTPEQVAIIRIHENANREDPNPVDVATYLRAQMDRFGWTQTQVAKHCGKSIGWVSQTLKLLELDAETRHMVATGELTARHGYLAARISDEPTRRVWAGHWSRFGTNVRLAEEQVQRWEAEKDRREELANAPPQDVSVPVVQYEEPKCRYCGTPQSQRPLVLRPTCDECDAAILRGIQWAEEQEGRNGK